MSVTERAITFECQGETLIGVLSCPAQPSARGVLIIVGGPQYRAGSHRQFVLLARHFAAAGYPTLRFDYRGMGDGDGEARNFLDIEADIRSAIAAFKNRLPELSHIVLLGLCDAASAALLYAHQDSSVKGLILLNPWVRSAVGQAGAYVKHYYARRVLSGEFWEKLLRGRLQVLQSVKEFARHFVTSLQRRAVSESVTTPNDRSFSDDNYIEGMYQGLRAFPGKTLLVLSGQDLTAKEFQDLTSRSRGWQRLLQSPRTKVTPFAEADHTFSSAPWQNELAAVSANWLTSW